MELFESPDLTTLDFLFVGLGEERSLEKEGRYTRPIARSHFWMLLPAQRNVKISSDEQHAIFARELQIALRWTLGFSEHYFEL